MAYLDGWRGVAIALLLIGHFFPVPGINLGAVGVNFFFVLSGLLMSRLLFVQRTSLASFYRRRVSRIVPAHVAFLGTITVIYWIVGAPISPRELLAALLFLNNYVGPVGGTGAQLMPFGHIWSLAVEEHSYVLLSLVAVASRRGIISAKGGITFLVALSVGFCTMYNIWNPPGLLFDEWLHTEVAAYGVMLSALLLLLSHHNWGRIHAGAAPLLILVGLAMHWWSIPPAVQRVIGVGCFAVALHLLAFSPLWLQRGFAWQPLRQLGLWSFSIYLWQQPFYLLMHKGDLSPVVALLSACACGVVSFYAIEMPLREYLNRNWGTGRATA